MPGIRRVTSPVKAVPKGRPDKPPRFGPRMASPGHGDEHMGATEEQMRPTLPPKSEDDEPKQG